MNRPRLIALVLALLTLLLYLPVGWHDFIVFDDGDYVSQNRIVQAGLTWRGIRWAFDSWHFSNWHPLTWLSHMLDCQLFGLNPGAQHLVNVLFHIANALLLFTLLRRITHALWPSAIIAALFAWHPLHVESVAWIAERKDVLSTFFGLLALLNYVSYTKSSSRRLYCLTLLLFACSLMSKPMLVTLPFVFLLLDYWPLKRIPVSASRSFCWRPLILEKIPFLVLTLGSCVVTALAQRESAMVPLKLFPFGLRLANAVLAYGRYLLKTVFPTDLALIYPLTSHFSWLLVALVAIMLLFVSALVWVLRSKRPYLLVGWFWFLGTLVPVIGLVQVGRASMADRYTYVPLIGVFIAVVFGLRDLWRHLRLRFISLGVLTGSALAACLVLTEHQLTFWRDDETLFGHVVAVTDNNVIALINYGVALEKLGHEDEAFLQYNKALRLDPDIVEAHDNIAIFLDRKGKLDEAMFHYRETLRLSPKSPAPHMNFGGLLVKLGRFDEAMQQFTEAAKLIPDDPRPLYLMGKALLREGRGADAITRFREALQRDANDVQTLVWLSRVLASDEDAAVRSGPQAVTFAEHANQLTEGKDSLVLDSLAMAYAEASHFENARRAAEIAIQIADSVNASEIAGAMRERLKLYEEEKPYRENFAQPGQ